jgi:hypothetical protein
MTTTFFRAEAARLCRRINRSVAAADDGDPSADRNAVERVGVNLLDERQGIDHLGQVFAGNFHPLSVAEADADEDGVEFVQLTSRNVCSDLHSAAKLHP